MRIGRLSVLLAALGVATLTGASPAVAGAGKLVYAFAVPPDGENPAGNLVALGGAFYGATGGGGTADLGTIYKIDLVTGTETVIYSFTGGSDGAGPFAGPIAFRGALYGTTYKGGAHGYGTVFRVDPGTGAETIVYSFRGGGDGELPQAALLNVGGLLYGTTAYGGQGDHGRCGCGTVFVVDPATGVERVIHSFQGGSDGAEPVASLIDVAGTLYGTTTSGGTYGTVFRVDPKSGAESVVHTFSGLDGAAPTASLIYLHGDLFGTTLYGGVGYDGGYGTVFALNPATGVTRVLYRFTSITDGVDPMGGLLYHDGLLYGTTEAGSGGDGGTVFTINPVSGAETNLLELASIGADASQSSLIAVGGTLLGTSLGGGSLCPNGYGCGTIFAFTP